jgi:hypothetical protein
MKLNCVLMILMHRWELSLPTLKELKFSFSVLNFEKYYFCCVILFQVLCGEKDLYGANLCIVKSTYSNDTLESLNTNLFHGP